MSRKRKSDEEFADILFDIRGEGARAAYRRGLKILNDDRASPTAQASIIRSFFQASGMSPTAADGVEKPAYEMTADELHNAMAALQRQHARISSELVDVEVAPIGGHGGDVFD